MLKVRKAQNNPPQAMQSPTEESFFTYSESSFDNLVGIKMLPVESVFRTPKTVPATRDSLKKLSVQSFAREKKVHDRKHTPVLVNLRRKDDTERYGMVMIMLEKRAFCLLSYESTPAWSTTVDGVQGIRFGDEILFVNGKAVTEFTEGMNGIVSEMYKSLSCTLTVVREPELTKCHVDTANWKKNKTRTLGALGIECINDQVTYVAPDSAAVRAGITSSHVVVKVGDVYTLGMSEAQLHSTLMLAQVKGSVNNSLAWARKLSGLSTKSDTVEVIVMEKLLYRNLTKSINRARLGEELRIADQTREYIV
ncbi:hypothetical protein SARC_00543 [Sphaeroforma arctica JP610]|uniref:PDZ domain-containing protein n=1 Tax=Sphaeroforma arctica JP610 TaxID=667725 RepID=A0A0L0GGB8_9EUKA|nr:hypothetical protein SARC_00543 [Sphaeroforma arctica JP610]KNC87353.1 hypothetical protein SARC_00543 [Sphaeroforma arctica JP610]|eukprot:XP_014161255.1 hypothetical protein SARC_00543 [Sphaeroforma arctica JP610]